MEESDVGIGNGTRWRRWLRALCAIGILLALLAGVYQHSFAHTPKRDQLYYLLEMSRTDGFVEILQKSLSYNRTRTVEASDTLLFRPGLFLLLAVQCYFFDYHFELSRWVSLGIHAVVCVLLFRLLNSLASYVRPGSQGRERTKERVVISGACLLFAFSPSIVEVVAWEHIQGYMVFTGLILVCLEMCVRIDSGEQARGCRRAIWLGLFAASFFHEAGILFAPVFGLFLAMPRSAGWTWQRASLIFGGFLLIPVIYGMISSADYLMHSAKLVREDFHSDLISGTEFGKTMHNWLRFFVYCCIQPICPFVLQTEYRSGQFIMIADLLAGGGKASASQTVLQVGLTLIALGAATMAGFFFWTQIKCRRYLPALLGMLLVIYISMYVVLRMNVRSEMHPNFLGVNSQYVYFCLPLSIGLIFWGFLKVASQVEKNRRNRLINVTIIYLAFALIYSMVQTWTINRSAVAFYSDVREDILLPASKALDVVLASGKTRIGFLFENPFMSTAYSRFGVPLTTIFFGRHEASTDVEAYIALPSGKIVAPDDALAKELIQTHANRFHYVETLPFRVVSLRGNGRLREFRAGYAIFRNGDEWMGNLSVYPFLPADLAVNLPFSVRGKDREEVVSRASQAADDAVEAARSGRLEVDRFGTPLVWEVYKGRRLVQAFGKFFALPLRAMTEEEESLVFEEKSVAFPAGANLEALKAKVDAVESPEWLRRRSQPVQLKAFELVQ